MIVGNGRPNARKRGRARRPANDAGMTRVQWTMGLMSSALLRRSLVLGVFVLGFAQSAAAQMQRVTLSVDGLSRSYELQVPAEGRNYPLLLVFHPGLSDPERFARVSGFADLAAQQKFAVAFLAGTDVGSLFVHGLVWNAGGCCSKAMREGIDDVAFVRAVIQQVTAKYPVDAHRIYAAGFSNGAMLVNVLAERLAGQIAAAAMVEGAGFRPVPPGRPLPVIIIHTLDDDIVPYAGGPSPNRMVQQSAPFLPVEETVGGWVDRDVCRSKDSKRKNGYTVIDYGKCSGGAVTFIVVNSGGHHWLRSPLDETTIIWDFLSRFSD
jgi:polyhydroxybutyrate depolymerase